MPFQVAVADETDLQRLFTIAAEAFGTNEPFWDTLYPAHGTEAGRIEGGERFVKATRSQPWTTFIKVYDPATGEIVGMSKWNLYRGKMPEYVKDSTNYWPSETERLIYEFKGQEFMKTRNAYIEQTNAELVSLDILAVDPRYQRMGVGDLMVKWGIEEADRQGVEAVVESSRFGKGLYMKNGFVFQRDVVIPNPPDAQHLPKADFAWLVRPKKVAS
nr:hypothetical protein CFP56_11304 [Quercus suber]